MYQSKKNKKLDIRKVIITAGLYIFAIISLYPFFLLFITTFKDERHIYDVSNIPKFTNFENYILVFTKSKFFLALFNTTIICISTLILVILFSSMAGYVISRSRERIFKVIYLIIVCGLIVPAESNMMVLYKLGNALHMINTIPYLVLIYVAGGAAFASLIYVAFTKSIPREIDEAAKIDGCGTYSTFFRIVFRLLLPATGAVIATTLFWWWNDFQGPLIYLNNGKFPTLMLEIFSFKTNIGLSGHTSTQWGPVFALCFLSSVPMLLFFLFTQKYLIKGMLAAAVKG